MFRHVVVAVDFTPGMHAMLRCLPGLRDLGAERLTFVHVARLESPITGWVRHLKYYEQKLQDEICPGLEREGFETDIVVVAGDPGEEITRIARERDASLVLVGSRGGSPKRERFLGSVAWEVVQRVSSPVLVQRVEPAFDDEEAPLVAACCDLRTRVLFPTDFSDASESAFRYVEAFARSGVESFVLLHVRAGRDDAEERSKVLSEDHLRLEVLAGRLHAAGAVRVRVELLRGNAVDELLRFADLSQNALMVLGTHGRGWLSELLIGSVSHDIVRRTRASVLLVRALRTESPTA